MRFLSKSSGSMIPCLLLRFLISSRASISSIYRLESYDLFSRYFIEFSSFSLTLSFLRYFSACWASLMASQLRVPPVSTTQSWFLGSVLKVISPQQQVHLKQNLKTLMPRQVYRLHISILMLNLVPMYRQLAQVLQRKLIGNMLRTIISLSEPRPRFTMREWSKFFGKYFIRTFLSAIILQTLHSFKKYQIPFTIPDLFLSLSIGLHFRRPYQFHRLAGWNNKIKNITSDSMKGAITITGEELAKMRMKANLLPNPDMEDNHPLHQLQESQKRTDQWSDNPKYLKQRKEEQRFKKFEKQEMQRRRIDEEQKKFQLRLKEQELAKANGKLFQETEQVRGLNSKLLYSDALKGREEQIEIKKYLQQIEKQKEQHFHQETLNQITRAEEEERKKKLEEKQKLKVFEKNLKKQQKQVIKQYVNKYQQEMEEGQLLKLKAEAAIKEEEQKEKDRRAKNMQNRKEVDVINQKNKQLRALQAQKEREEQLKIQEYRKKKEIKEDLTKKRQQDLIYQKIQQREELYKQQSFKMSQIKNNDVERLTSQVEELEKKQAEIQRKKHQENKLLKQQYEESLKDQVQRRKRQKDQQVEDNQKFKETWKEKLTTLKGIQDQQDKFRKNLYQKNSDDLKRQMEEKRVKRQQKFKQELNEAEQAKANIENQEKQFKSYAEKCLKEWQSNGKNLYPIIKQLTATMKQS